MPGKKMNSIKDKDTYEAVKEKLVDQGVPLQEAKTRAAKIANSDAPKRKKK